MFEYKHIFGKPGLGAHKHVFGVAIVDVILALFMAIFISVVASVNLGVSIVGTALLGIFSHWLFGVPTAVNVALGV